MSSHVIAFRPPDDLWGSHKSIWDSCKAIGISPPRETIDFFQGEAPDERGIEIDLTSTRYKDCCRPWEEDSAVGYEIVLENLPKDITVVRFFNCW